MIITASWRCWRRSARSSEKIFSRLSATRTLRPGSYRLPSLGLRGALDEAARVVYVLDDANGEALRVYARLFDGQVQYALAGRNSNGELRLAAWSSFAGEPTLSWTARQAATGWVLESVTLR